MSELRRLGTTDIRVSPLALGCWPLAGMTRTGVVEADGLAALETSFELGVNFVDTAYCYGQAGESERIVGRAIATRRDSVVVATKGGLHWEPPRQQNHDARPETLKREIDESLRRLGTDRVELLYLHAPDPKIPLAESAGALGEILQSGKARSIGVSNVNLRQLEEFAAACPLTAFQPPYNMLQRGIELDTLPWCVEHQVAVIVYWPLMKGLLAGRLPRDHIFPATDSRHKYPMFQGDEFQLNQDFVDALRPIAAESGHSVAELVLNWTFHQQGITSVLCGATTAVQARENSGSLGWALSADQLDRVNQAIAARGPAKTRSPV